ncbi:MAG: FGLLP motif-containing membrane protein [Actinomycetota bacterium]
MSARAAGGGTQAPPGGELDLSAGGFASCSEVLFLLDGIRIGSRVPAPDGSASIDGVSVPGDAKPGIHSVSARCDGPGFGAPRTRITVTSPVAHRTALVTSIPQPWQVPLDAVSIGISLLAALGMIVLVAIPAELFNSTLEENNAEVRAFLHLPARRREPRQTLSPAATFALFVLVGGFLYALLSPGFGPDASSFALVAGMTVALAVTTAGFAFPQGAYMRRRFGDRGRLSVVPATLVVSTVFVILSLAIQLNPGLIYGVVAGFAFRNALAEDEEGRLAAWTTLCLLLVCLGAWFARAAILNLAARPDAGFMILAAEAALAGIVLVGLESLTIGLIPLKALNGRKIANWSFPAWMAVFTITAAAFVHILLTPSSGYVSPLQGRSGIIFLALAGLLAAGAVAFWAYFQFREPRKDR